MPPRHRPRTESPRSRRATATLRGTTRPPPRTASSFSRYAPPTTRASATARCTARKPRAMAASSRSSTTAPRRTSATTVEGPAAALQERLALLQHLVAGLAGDLFLQPAAAQIHRFAAAALEHAARAGAIARVGRGLRLAAELAHELVLHRLRVAAVQVIVLDAELDHAGGIAGAARAQRR